MKNMKKVPPKKSGNKVPRGKALVNRAGKPKGTTAGRSSKKK